MELEVYKINGEKADRKVVLNDSIFNVEPSDHAIYLDVKQHLANRRQGTASTLEKGDVTASTRKIKRQKGTGTARAGSAKSHIFRGGGTAFGPEPRDYNFKLNKKLKQLARKSALTYKARENQIIILEKFSLDEAKTKKYLEILQQFEMDGKKSLLIIPATDKNIYLASRNLKKAKVIIADNLNTYEVLHTNNLLIVEDSLEILENKLAKN
ncbi:MAG: 50S ribosomal protein L4 [Bacteroidales bacterium]|nr:50S ribosomal protein L4 [Bacteroidales bacterium]